jgi:hypothetical protein
VVWSRIARPASTSPERGVERVDLSLVATLAFFEPTNSGRGGKRERVPVGVEGGAPASASGK